MGRVSVLVIAVLVLTLGPAADAGSPYGKRVATDTGTGDFAVAEVHVTIRKPRAMTLVVKGDPSGFEARTTWSMLCKVPGDPRNYGFYRVYDGRTPKVLRSPRPPRRTKYCITTARSELEAFGGSPKIKVSIYAKRRR